MADVPTLDDRSGLAKLVQNPWFNLAGLAMGVLIGVIGIGLSIYFYSLTPHRALSYWVSPSRYAVLKNGAPSDLDVKYKGRAVQTDLSVAQITIWNAGKESIRPQNVLEPVLISTAAPILDVSIIRSGRPLSQVRINGLTSDNSVALDWRILEQNDGATLQIVYGGDINVPVSVSGVIEGQGSVIQQGVVQSASATWRVVVPVLGSAFIGTLLTLVTLGKRFRSFVAAGKNETSRDRRSTFAAFLTLVPGITLAVLVAFILDHFTDPGVPQFLR